MSLYRCGAPSPLPLQAIHHSTKPSHHMRNIFIHTRHSTYRSTGHGKFVFLTQPFVILSSLKYSDRWTLLCKSSSSFLLVNYSRPSLARREDATLLRCFCFWCLCILCESSGGVAQLNSLLLPMCTQDPHHCVRPHATLAHLVATSASGFA